jgi:hypothetical protein
MMPATLEIRTVKISTGEKKKDQLVFSGKHEKVIFEGFLKAQNMHKGKSNKQKDNDEPENSSGEENETENKDNNNEDENDTNEEENENNEIKTANSEHNKYLETIFDKLKENQEVFTQSMSSNEKYSKPKHSRYTEASLVSAMEKLGIGRPSTYSSAVKKIQDKEYVERKSLPAKKVNLTSLYYNYPEILQNIAKTLLTIVESNENLPNQSIKDINFIIGRLFDARVLLPDMLFPNLVKFIENDDVVIQKQVIELFSKLSKVSNPIADSHATSLELQANIIKFIDSNNIEQKYGFLENVLNLVSRDNAEKVEKFFKSAILLQNKKLFFCIFF